MSTPTTSQDWEPDPAWPATAIPQRWVEALFASMSATYGVRFADLWRGTKIDQVKRNWGIELSKLSSQQMRAGRESMINLEKPPTLPEFVAHCRRARVEAAAAEAPKQLEQQMPLITPEQAEENRQLLARTLGRMQRAEPSAEWAFRLVLRGKTDSGNPLPFNVARTATDAITSKAGQKVIDDCTDPELKAEYAAMRQTIVDNYRMRGQPLWETP